MNILYEFRIFSEKKKTFENKKKKTNKNEKKILPEK